jgi:hypothetical protein
MEKTSKGKQKKGMNRQSNNQAPTPSPAHDLKHVQCESDGKSKRMLIKEWSCNLSKIFF